MCLPLGLAQIGQPRRHGRQVDPRLRATAGYRGGRDARRGDTARRGFTFQISLGRCQRDMRLIARMFSAFNPGHLRRVGRVPTRQRARSANCKACDALRARRPFPSVEHKRQRRPGMSLGGVEGRVGCGGERHCRCNPGWKRRAVQLLRGLHISGFLSSRSLDVSVTWREKSGAVQGSSSLRFGRRSMTS